MFCRKCGAELAEGSVFCRKCGAKQTPAEPDKKFCRKCGAELSEGSVFCRKCGAKTAVENEQKTYCRKCGAEIMFGLGFCYKCGTEQISQKPDKTGRTSAPAGRGTSAAVENTSKRAENNYTATDAYNESHRQSNNTEPSCVERSSTSFSTQTRTIEQKISGIGKIIRAVFSLIGVIIAIIVLVNIFNGNIGKEIEDVADKYIVPGLRVRQSYLTQYSNTVTIEKAFENFFANTKWKEEDHNGYTYVYFTGKCTYLDKPADVRITFKITGDNFTVDSIDINGQTQGLIITAAFLEKIYDSYDTRKI